MQGVSSSLMSAELKSAKDLGNIFLCPHPRLHPQECSPPDQSAAGWQGTKQTLIAGKHTQTRRSGMNWSVAIGCTAQPLL